MRRGLALLALLALAAPAGAQTTATQTVTRLAATARVTIGGTTFGTGPLRVVGLATRASGESVVFVESDGDVVKGSLALADLPSGVALRGSANTFTAANTFQGNVSIGDATSDTVTLTARLASGLAWSADNASDIGASGANRPRDFYLGRNATIGGTLGVTGAATFSSAIAANGGSITSTGALAITSAASQNLTLNPGGDLYLTPGGADVLPGSSYAVNVGAMTARYLTGHFAELWSSTLVAADVLSTLNGRVLVTPATVLAANLAAGATTISVKAPVWSGCSAGAPCNAYLERSGQVEFVQVTSASSGSGPYTYTVARNLDGSGSDAWLAGDGIATLGAAVGAGFLDLYALRGVRAGTEVGPTIVGNVRRSNTYNDWVPAWAIGNLNGLYGYSSNLYGVALGRSDRARVLVDESNGIRLLDSAGTARVTIGPGATATFNGDGSGVTAINGGNITTGTISADRISAGSLNGDKITAGTITADRLAIGTSGGNWLTNPTLNGLEEPACSGGSWGAGFNNSGLSMVFGSGYSGYEPLPSSVGYFYLNGTPAAGNGAYTDCGLLPAEGGATYQFSGYLGAHRGHGSACVGFYDSADTWLGFSCGNAVNDGTYGGNRLSLFGRSVVTVVAPAGAKQALLAFYLNPTGAAYPYLFFTHTLFSQVPAGTSAAVQWAAGGVTRINGSQIVTGTVTAERLSATAINGKTITGATLQTGNVDGTADGAVTVNNTGITLGTATSSSSPARVFLGGTSYIYATSASLFVQNSSGNVTVQGTGASSALYLAAPQGVQVYRGLYPGTSTGGYQATYGIFRSSTVNGLRINGDVDAQGVYLTGWATGTGALLRKCSTTGTAADWICAESSSRRYKRAIAPAVEPWERILELAPRTYRYVASEVNPDPPVELGAIAEEVEALGLRGLVLYDGAGRPDGLRYERMALYLIPVVRAQRDRIAALEARVAAVEAAR